jgi:alanine racemase
MVKADAYGLGVREVVRALTPERPWGWGVATVDEGLGLRGLGVSQPVIVCSPVVGSAVRDALAGELQLTVSSLDALQEVVAAARSLGARPNVHLDVDTGMGRSGFDWRTARDWLPGVLAAQNEVRWSGCQTHLHSADETEESVREQWARFEGVLREIGDRLPGLTIHLLNSAGALRLPELAHAAVRPGIFLYGGRAGAGLPVPEAVASLHARVVHLRDAEPGTTLGYGATYRASGEERWATLSIGYGDGLPRALGKRGQALNCGRRVKIVGRISMDMTVVDITGVPGVRSGDVATLLGTEGGESITVDDVAELAGTISYEVLTGLTQRLPRLWTGLDRGQ